MKTLRDLLPFISYNAQLHIVETERSHKRYEYVFSSTELVQRGTIEEFYPDLLDRELSDGIHGEGMRDGVYIHLYKE